MEEKKKKNEVAVREEAADERRESHTAYSFFVVFCFLKGWIPSTGLRDGDFPLALPERTVGRINQKKF